MEHGTDHNNQPITASAQQVRLAAETAAETMAISALSHCNTHFERSMSDGAALWIKEKCDPGAMAALGQTSAALVKTGKKRAALELSLYTVTFAAFGATGLWMVAAPIWAFAAAVPTSGAFALLLSLSGNDEV